MLKHLKFLNRFLFNTEQFSKTVFKLVFKIVLKNNYQTEPLFFLSIFIKLIVDSFTIQMIKHLEKGITWFVCQFIPFFLLLR